MVAKELEYLLHLFAESELLGVNILHQEGRYVIDRGLEHQPFAILEVCHHEQYIHDTLGKFHIARILQGKLSGIVERLLPLRHEHILEHRLEKLVKRYEMVNFVVLCQLGGIVCNLDDRTFVSLHLGIDKPLFHEGVEHLCNKLQLVRNERIVVHEVIRRLVGLVNGRQLELGHQGVLLLRVHFAQNRLSPGVLFKHALLGNEFSRGTLEGHADLETTHNLAVIVGCLGNLTGIHDFGQILLRRTGHPNFVLTIRM